MTTTLHSSSSNGPRSMAVKDVAAELGVSVATAHKYVQSGDLPAVDIGTGAKSYWRIERADFEKFLAKRREATARRFGGAA